MGEITTKNERNVGSPWHPFSLAWFIRNHGSTFEVGGEATNHGSLWQQFKEVLLESGKNGVCFVLFQSF